MPIICPAILAPNKEEYREQMEKVANFADRIQIDLTDGVFAKNPTPSPEDAWWPVGIKPDFHLMYKQPLRAVKTILEHQPNLIIVHAEADGNFESFAQQCHSRGVKVGIALLQRTPVESIEPALHMIDHVLIFSGDLGSFGGQANLGLLEKVETLKQNHPDIEVGWDGGINDQNISRLAAGGVDVFDVGGYIQKSPDPERAFKALSRIADETGTT